jgi:hypothetical protein
MLLIQILGIEVELAESLKGAWVLCERDKVLARILTLVGEDNLVDRNVLKLERMPPI